MLSDPVANGPSPGMSRRRPAGLGPLAVHGGGIAALTLVLVSAGAFDSDELPLDGQLLMLAIVSTLLVVQSSLLAQAVRRLRGSPSLAVAGAAAAAMVVALLLMTIEVHALKFTPVVPYAPDPLPDFALFLMPFVLPVTAFVLGLHWTIAGRAAVPASAGPKPVVVPRHMAVPPEPSALVPPPPIAGWPAAPVRRVQAVDHYLHLWTESGVVLVRGRMGDALRRLPPSAGIRVHRSWWIARSEVDRLERQGRDHVLRLHDGGRVPVARARTEAVRHFIAG